MSGGSLLALQLGHNWYSHPGLLICETLLSGCARRVTVCPVEVTEPVDCVYPMEVTEPEKRTSTESVYDQKTSA